MIPILFGLVIILLVGGIVFCVAISGYQNPDEWWGEGADPENAPRLSDA